MRFNSWRRMREWLEERRKTREALFALADEKAELERALEEARIMAPAQHAYDADVMASPAYASDGTQRKTWDQLTAGERSAWVCAPRRWDPPERSVRSVIRDEIKRAKQKRRQRKQDEIDDFWDIGCL